MIQMPENKRNVPSLFTCLDFRAFQERGVRKIAGYVRGGDSFSGR